MPKRAVRRWLVLVCVLTPLGCDDSDRFRDVRGQDRPGVLMDGSTADMDGATGSGSGGGSASNGGGGNGADNGNGDGGPFGDGGSLDGAMDGLYILDGSVRLPEGSELLDDGGILLADGEVIDEMEAERRYGEDVDVETCSVSELDTWETSVELSGEGGFALAPGAIEGFDLAYQAIAMGGCTQTVHVMHLPSTGAFPLPSEVLDDCKVIRDVAVLGGREQSHLAWVDNFTDTAELHTLELGTTLELPSVIERNTITDSMAELELRPTLGYVNGRPLLTYIVRDSSAMQQGIHAALLDDDADPFAIVEKGSEHSPQGLALTGVGIDGNGALAWVGPQQNPGVWLQALDSEGRPVGSPDKLTERVGASSSVSLAMRRDGGAIAYSIVIDGIPQVRFRRLDGSGQAIGDERSVVGPPTRAQDAAIASIGGGYVLVYRALSGTGQTGPEVRMAFLTREGSLLKDDAGRSISYLVAPATSASARLQVAVSLDGQLMIGWLDADPSKDTNLLKLVRRRLDCAQ